MAGLLQRIFHGQVRISYLPTKTHVLGTYQKRLIEGEPTEYYCVETKHLGNKKKSFRSLASG